MGCVEEDDEQKDEQEEEAAARTVGDEPLDGRPREHAPVSREEHRVVGGQ